MYFVTTASSPGFAHLHLMVEHATRRSWTRVAAIARAFARQIRPHALDPLTRHTYSVFLNTLLLVLLFLAIDMYFGARDTRALGLMGVFTGAIYSQAEGAACGAAGISSTLRSASAPRTAARVRAIISSALATSSAARPSA